MNTVCTIDLKDIETAKDGDKLTLKQSKVRGRIDIFLEDGNVETKPIGSVLASELFAATQNLTNGN